MIVFCSELKTYVWHLFLPNGSTMRVSGLGRGNVVTNDVRRNGGAMRKNSVTVHTNGWLSERVTAKTLTYVIYNTRFCPGLSTLVKKCWTGSVFCATLPLNGQQRGATRVLRMGDQRAGSPRARGGIATRDTRCS